jgi:hypothetical protein
VVLGRILVQRACGPAGCSFGRVPELVLGIFGVVSWVLGLVPWAACCMGYCYVLGKLLCSGSSIKVVREVCGRDLGDSLGT